MKKPFYYSLFILVGLMTAINCDPAEKFTSGTLQVKLTDAPAAYESVLINVKEIRVHKNSNAEDDESGWRTITDQPVRVDLMNLTNGITEILGEAELEAGTYNQMRVVLGNQNELVTDGETHPLTTPSAQQSGLKLNINAEIESNSTYTLLLDFDASRSIIQAGSTRMFLLKPVIRTVNLAESGAIRGSVEPEDARPWVYAIAEQDTIAGTQATSDGNFLLIGLSTRNYNLSLIPSDEQLNPTVLPNVNVTAPDTTIIDSISLENTDSIL